MSHPWTGTSGGPVSATEGRTAPEERVDTSGYAEALDERSFAAGRRAGLEEAAKVAVAIADNEQGTAQADGALAVWHRIRALATQTAEGGER